jgi:hypothetical protein
VVHVAIKPTSSIRLEKASIDRAGQPTTVVTHGRHDPCVGIRATPIAEAMLALVVMDHVLRHRAQCGDVSLPVPPDSRRARVTAGARRHRAPSRRPCGSATSRPSGCSTPTRRCGSRNWAFPRWPSAASRRCRAWTRHHRALRLGLAGRPQRASACGCAAGGAAASCWRLGRACCGRAEYGAVAVFTALLFLANGGVVPLSEAAGAPPATEAAWTPPATAACACGARSASSSPCWPLGACSSRVGIGLFPWLVVAMFNALLVAGHLRLPAGEDDGAGTKTRRRC